MNDTPRTDAEVFLLFKTGDDEGVTAEFARKLERENAALRNEVVRLNNQTMWVCSCGGTDCAGQKENAALRQALEDMPTCRCGLSTDEQCALSVQNAALRAALVAAEDGLKHALMMEPGDPFARMKAITASLDAVRAVGEEAQP